MLSNTISLNEKYLLTIKEAAIVFHLGQKKLYQLVQENPTAEFYIMNGNKILIKRKQFECFIDQATVL